MKILAVLTIALFFFAPPALAAGGATISADNSTTKLLAGGAVFTGVGEDVSHYSTALCAVYSDAASALTATTGFSMELSTDGTNWDRKQVTHVEAAKSQEHALPLIGKFFRVVYTNGSVTQTEFRLQCKLSLYQTPKTVARSTQLVRDIDDVELVRTLSTYNLDVARGLIQDHSWRNVFGENPAVSGTEEVIWESGGPYTGFITSAIQMEILSDDADDKSDGNGARTVKIEYLDSTFAEQTETITMNGVTPVATTATDIIRVNKIEVVTAGVYATSTVNIGANEGLITLRGVSDTPIMATISTGEGVSEMAVYTVPLGKTAYITRFQASLSETANESGTIKLFSRRDADDVSAPFTPREIHVQEEDFSGQRNAEFSFSIVFPAKTDIFWTAVRTGSQDAVVDLDFELLLVTDETLPAIP